MNINFRTSNIDFRNSCSGHTDFSTKESYEPMTAGQMKLGNKIEAIDFNYE